MVVNPRQAHRGTVRPRRTEPQMLVKPTRARVVLIGAGRPQGLHLKEFDPAPAQPLLNVVDQGTTDAAAVIVGAYRNDMNLCADRIVEAYCDESDNDPGHIGDVGLQSR